MSWSGEEVFTKKGRNTVYKSVTFLLATVYSLVQQTKSMNSKQSLVTFGYKRDIMTCPSSEEEACTKK